MCVYVRSVFNHAIHNLFVTRNCNKQLGNTMAGNEDIFTRCWWNGEVERVDVSADGNTVDIRLDSFQPDMHVLSNELRVTPKLSTDMTLGVVLGDGRRVNVPARTVRIQSRDGNTVNDNTRGGAIGTVKDRLVVRVARNNDQEDVCAWEIDEDGEEFVVHADDVWGIVQALEAGMKFVMVPHEPDGGIHPSELTPAQWKHEVFFTYACTRVPPPPEKRWAWCERLLRFNDPLEARANNVSSDVNGDADENADASPQGIMSVESIESVFESMEMQFEEWTIRQRAMHNRGMQLGLLKPPLPATGDGNGLDGQADSIFGGVNGRREAPITAETLAKEKDQVLMMQYMQHISQVAVDAYEMLYANYKFKVNFHRPMQATLYPKRPWFDRMKDFDEEDNESSLVTKYLLKCASDKQLKKNGDVVYAPKTVHAFQKWEPPAGNKTCQHPGCLRKATFGFRPADVAVPHVRQRRSEHGRTSQARSGKRSKSGKRGASRRRRADDNNGGDQRDGGAAEGEDQGAQPFPRARSRTVAGANREVNEPDDDDDDQPMSQDDGVATADQAWEQRRAASEAARMQAGEGDDAVDADDPRLEEAFHRMVNARHWCLEHARRHQDKLIAQGDDRVLEDLRYSADNKKPTPLFGAVRTVQGVDGRSRRMGEWTTVNDVPTGSWIPLQKTSDLFALDVVPLTIYDWASRIINSTHTPGLEHLATKHLPLKRQAVAYITSASEVDFPNWVPDRFTYSFRNGVYRIDNGVFYEYMTDMWQASEKSSVNYIDEVFHPNWSVQAPDEIPVEWYDLLLRTQYPETMDQWKDIRMWHDIGLGRLFVPVGVYENWERLMVIKGYAGTGKSTIANAIRLCVGVTNVGNVPTNLEVQWALQPVKGKAMWMCAEMKKNFRLDLATMQSMVSGEMVQISAKNQAQVDIPRWTAPGIVFGNELPDLWMLDAMNAIARRLLMFPYEMRPKQVNLTVGASMRHTLAPFLARITRQYFRMVAIMERTKKPLDDMLPRVLLDSTEEFKRMTNPVLTFLESKAVVVECQYHCLDALTSGANPVLKAVDLTKLGLTFEDVARGKAAELQANPGLAHDFDVEKYRIPHEQIHRMFNAWFSEFKDSGRAKPSFTQSGSYDPACWEKKIAVVGGFGNKYWYGVRAPDEREAPDGDVSLFGYVAGQMGMGMVPANHQQGHRMGMGGHGAGQHMQV
jgi:hypothetical protein